MVMVDEKHPKVSHTTTSFEDNLSLPMQSKVPANRSSAQRHPILLQELLKLLDLTLSVVLDALLEPL